MKSQQLRRLFLLSVTAGLFASQSVMALSFQDPFNHLDPAPDPDLLALSIEDEAYIQNLFDQFELTSEERSQLLNLIDPKVPGVIEDFDLSREPEAPIPMEEHPEYIELMERMSRMNEIAVSDCGHNGHGVYLDGLYRYYLAGDISCSLKHSTNAGIFLGGGATLDLRGHSVTSTNNIGRGIQLAENTAVFGGGHEHGLVSGAGNHARGLVSGFETGIYSESNLNLVIHVETSNNIDYGIHMFREFGGSVGHYFDNHRVLYSVANNNGGVGISFEITDNANGKGDLSVFRNYIYASETNGNKVGIEIMGSSNDTTHHYKHVGIYGNSISHNRVRDNVDHGVAFTFEHFMSTGGFSVYENHISHNSVRCEPVSPCHFEGGIIFKSAVNDTSEAGIEMKDNLIYANWVDYSLGDGIIFEIDLEELGSGESNFNNNFVMFNNLEYNAQGMGIGIGTGTDVGNSNITDNLFAFNRAANSGLGNDGIFVQIDGNSNSGAMSIDDNLLFGNILDENYFGMEARLSANVAANVGTASADVSRNLILFNQVSSNIGFGFSSTINVNSGGTASAHDNRMGFNRVVDNVQVGLELELNVQSFNFNANTARAIHNRVDHNIVLDNPGEGVVFIVASHNSNGKDISYKNRVSKNLVVENENDGIRMESDSVSPDDSDRNGVFRNLVVDTDGDGIVMQNGSNNLVRRNFVADNTGDGIQVSDLGDVISKNISIGSGDYNMDDLSGEADLANCNDWDKNFLGDTTKINPQECFEVKA